MDKKLLLKVFTFWALILTSALGWGQCPTSVGINTNPGNTICAGESIKFSATHQDGDNLQYQWQINGVNVPNETEIDFTTSKLENNDKVRVVVSSSIETCTITSDYITVIVNANPTVNAGGAISAICQGGTTAALGGSFGGGATSAIWSADVAGGSFSNNSGSNPGSTTYTAPASISSPTTITLMLTTGGGSCGTVNASKTITVNVNPTVNPGEAVAAICQGETTVALGGSFGGGATSAIWSDGGAGGTFTNNSGSNPGSTTYKAPASAPTSIILTLTTSGGSCGTVSASKTLTVNPNPIVDAGGAITVFCQGGTTGALGGSFSGGATSAIWSDGNAGGTFSNNTGSNPNTTTYTAAADAPSTVTLTLTTAGGSCGTVSATKTLNIYPNPTVDAGGAIAAICQGGTTTALGGSFGGGATSAIWSDGGAGGSFTDNSGSNPGNTSYTASASAPASITLALTTAGGSCGTVTATKTLNVNPNPTVSAGAALSDICQGGTTGALGGSFGGGATSAIWSDGGAGGTFINNSGNNPESTTYTASASAPATVTLTLTTSGGSCSTVKATKTLKVNPTILPTVSITSSTTNICTTNGIPVTFTATPVNGGTNPTYQWKRNGSNIPGATGATYTATSAQTSSTITVVMTSNALCASPASVTSDGIDLNAFNGAPGNWTSEKIDLPASVCPPGQIKISIPTVPNAEYYKWTLPQGFTIINQEIINGKVEITVEVDANAKVGNNQDVTVQAFNPCGSNGSKTAKINVNNFTGVTVPSPTASVCAENSITVVGTLRGNAASGTWTANPATSGTFSNIVTSTTTPTTVTATFTPSITSGTVDLIITTNAPTGNGCSNSPGTAKITLTVNAPSTAPTTLNTSVTTICKGESTVLTQTGGSLGTGASWKWYSDSNFTTLVGPSPDANAGLTVSPTATTTYYLRAESTTGAPCTANVPATGSVTVTVNEPSIAPTALNASLATICNGESTALTQTGGILGTGASWKWYSDSNFATLVGTSTDANASFTVSPSTTTTYYLRAESTTGAPCTANVPATGSVTVIVNEPSIAPTALDASVATICNGESTTLTQTGGTLGTGASWKWYSDSSYTISVGTSTDANASLTVSPTATTTYYLRAESTTGAPCIANVPATGSVTVTVNEPSIAPTALDASLATICNGESTALTQTGGILGTGASWKWYSDSNFATLVGTSTDANASFTVSPSTTTTYYLRAESTTGAPCTANVPATGSVTVTVNEPSIAPTALDASVATICNGESTTLTQTGGTLGTGASWKWYSDSNYTISVGTSTDANASLTVSPTATTTYYLRAESTTGAPCTANVPATGSVTVTVNESVVITKDLDETPVEVCAGFPVTFSIEATGTVLSYQWTRDGQPVGTDSPTLNIAQATASDAGLYTVLVKGTAPCTDVQSTKQVELIVNQSITINQQPPPNLEVCEGTQSLTINITADGTVYDYVWRKNEIPVTYDGVKFEVSETNGSLTINNLSPDDSGSYDVVMSSPAESCSQIISNPSVVTVSPTVTIDPFATETSNRCQGAETVTITTTANNTTGLTYSLDSASLAGGNTIDADSGAVTYSADWSGTTTITASAAGCNGPVTATHIVTTTPTVTIDPFATEPLTRCQGAETVTTTTTANNTTELTYSLDATSLAGGNTVNAETGAVTYAADWSGTTTITASASGCNGPVTTTYTVTTTPTVTIEPFATEPLTRCQGAETITTTTTANNTTELTYNLDAASLAGGNTINAETGAVTYAADWSGTTTITASAAGCNGPVTETHVVTTTPTVTIDPFTTATSVRCQGAATITTTTTANNATGITYSLDQASLEGGNTIDSVTGAVTYAADWLGTTTITASAAGCSGPVTTTHIITTDSPPVGGTLAFEGIGRVFTTCENAANGYATTLKLTGETGQVVGWEYKTASATTWSPYDSQNKELSSSEVETIVNNVSTVIRAKIINGACNDPVNSATAIVSVIPSNIKPSPVEAEPTIVCYGTDISLSSKTGYGESFGHFEGGDFTNAGIKNNGWNFTDPDGNEISFDANADSGAPIHWHKTQPKWKFATADIYTNAITEMWWNPLADGKTNEHFAIAQSTYDSNMDTPPFTLSGMDEAVITFDQAYNLTTGATIRVVLLKNGAEYKELDKIEGPASSGNYVGFASGTPGVNKMSYDLGSYLGESGLSVRFEYRGVRNGDIWAVDNIKVPEGPQGVLLQWFYDDNPNDATVEQIGQDNQEVVSFTPRKIGWNHFEVKTALLLDSNGNACESLDNFERVRVFVFDTYETTVAISTGTCGSYTATLDASIKGALQGNLEAGNVTLDGYKGEWKVENPEGVNFTLKNADGNTEVDPIYNPNVIFESEGDAEFTITWELKPTKVYPDDYPVVELRGLVVENPACPPVSIPVTPEFPDCTTLDFDGDDDVVIIQNTYADAQTVEAWIYPKSSTGTIFSSPGIEISMSDMPGTVVPNSRWYHIAVVGSRLYVDGIDTEGSVSGTGTGTRTYIGARWSTTDKKISNYFTGWIEEVRIWKTALDIKDIRFMMNQRLKLESRAVDAIVEGEIVPNKTIDGSYNTQNGLNLDENGRPFYNLNWNSLLGYFRLISADPDPMNLIMFDDAQKPQGGFTPDLSLTDTNGRLLNMTTNQENTSPTPYFSGANGDWFEINTWARPQRWNVPNTSGMEWNVVRILSSVHSEENVEVLGLDVSATGTFDMKGKNPSSWETGAGGEGKPLYISHYLLLNGIIDLNGESQLLQPHGSLVDGSSKGHLDRDQQGTASSYNYNYWVSPVGADASNAAYNVASVLLDGTNAQNPGSLAFGGDYNFADNYTPGQKRISEYWLHKFHGSANDYFKWDHIGSTGTMNVGEGFSMKGTMGSADIDDTQNYTFRGLPNNGTISPGDTSPQQNYLIGNPYPSAIDANKFIADNLAAREEDDTNVFNGTVYFWSHFANKTHYLEEYIGGYAAYNISGGVQAAAIDERINATEGKGGEMPQQYIPVGQAFFINTVIDPVLEAALAESDNLFNSTVGGGEVIFKNSQRVFAPENGSYGGSVFHSQEKKEVATANTNNSSFQEAEQNKIWLKFKSPKGYHRQILVTADQRATENFDLGFDAPMIDENVEDMYWYFNKYQFVIQGVPDFNVERVLDLGINVDQKGPLSISIDDLENIPDEMNIYVADSLLQVVHDLRVEPYETESEAGTFTNRFKLVFQDKTQIEEPEVPVIEEGPFEVLYVTGTRNVLLRNPELLKVDRVYLNNMLGQQVHVYYNVPSENEVELPVKRFSAGVYIVKVHYEGGIVTRKIILE